MHKKIFPYLIIFLLLTVKAFALTTILETTFPDSSSFDYVTVESAQDSPFNEVYIDSSGGLVLDATGQSTITAPVGGDSSCSSPADFLGEFGTETFYYRLLFTTYDWQYTAIGANESCATTAGDSVSVTVTWPTDTRIDKAMVFSSDTSGDGSAYEYQGHIERGDGASTGSLKFYRPPCGSWGACSGAASYAGAKVIDAGETDGLGVLLARPVVKDGQFTIGITQATTGEKYIISVRRAYFSQISNHIDYYSAIDIICDAGTGCDLKEYIENTVFFNPATCTTNCADYDDGSEHEWVITFNDNDIHVTLDTTTIWGSAGAADNSLQAQTKTNQSGYISVWSYGGKVTVNDAKLEEDESKFSDTYEYWNCNQGVSLVGEHNVGSNTSTAAVQDTPLSVFHDDVRQIRAFDFNPVTRSAIGLWRNDCTTAFLPDRPIYFQHADGGSINLMTTFLPTIASEGMPSQLGHDYERMTPFGLGNTQVSQTDAEAFIKAGGEFYLDTEAGGLEYESTLKGHNCDNAAWSTTELEEWTVDQFYHFPAIIQNWEGRPQYANGIIMNCASTRTYVHDWSATVDTNISGMYVAHGGGAQGGITNYQELPTASNRRTAAVPFYNSAGYVNDPLSDLEKYFSIDRLIGDYTFEKYELVTLVSDVGEGTESSNLQFDDIKIELDYDWTQELIFNRRPEHADYGWVEQVGTEDADYIEKLAHNKLVQISTGSAATERQLWRKSFDTLGVDLVSHWKLEESSGTRLDDRDTNNDLTDNNTVTSNTGKFGTAAQFTAANSEFLDIADGSCTDCDGMAEVTPYSWIYIDALPTTGNHQMVMAKNAASQQSYMMQIRESGGNYLMRCGLNTASGGFETTDSATGVITSTATWYQVACVYDGVTLQPYLNGSSSGAGLAKTGTVVDSTATLALGYLENGAQQYFDGRIDDAALWKRALTADEISTLYNSGTGTEIATTETDGYFEAKLQVKVGREDCITTRKTPIFDIGIAQLEFCIDWVHLYINDTLKESYEIDTIRRPHRYGLMVENSLDLSFYIDGVSIRKWENVLTSGVSLIDFGINDGSAVHEVVWGNVKYVTDTDNRYDYGLIETPASPARVMNAADFKAVGWNEFLNGSGRVHVQVKACDDVACASGTEWLPDNDVQIFDMDTGESCNESDDGNTDCTFDTSIKNEGTASLKITTTDGSSNGDIISVSRAALDLSDNEELLNFDFYGTASTTTDAIGCGRIKLHLSEGSTLADSAWSKELCLNNSDTWEDYYADFSQTLSPSWINWAYWPMEELEDRYDIPNAYDLEEVGAVTRSTGVNGYSATFDNNAANYLKSTTVTRLRDAGAETNVNPAAASSPPAADTSWWIDTGNAWTAVSTDPNTGTYHFLGATPGTGSIYQVITVASQGATPYRATVYSNLDSGSTTVPYELRVLNNDTGAELCAVAIYITDTTWTAVNCDFSVTGTLDVKVVIDDDGTGTDSSPVIHVDDFHLATYDAPCSGATSCTWRGFINHTGGDVTDTYFDSDYLEVKTNGATPNKYQAIWDGTDTITCTTSVSGGSTYDWVVFTYDASGNASCYVNSTTPEDTTATTAGTLATDVTMRFGQTEAGANPATGSIDGVIIDETVWSAEQLAFDYNSGAPRDYRNDRVEMDMDAITHIIFEIIDDTGSPTFYFDDIKTDKWATDSNGSIITGFGTNVPYHRFRMLLTSDDKQISSATWPEYSFTYNASGVSVTIGGGGGNPFNPF